MSAKLSEDMISLSDLKVDVERMLRWINETHHPVVLTDQGQGVAVIQSINDYEESEEERKFMRGVVRGLADVEAGRTVSLEEAKVRLGLS